MAKCSGYHLDPPPQSRIEAIAKRCGYDLDPPPQSRIEAIAKRCGYDLDPPPPQLGIEAIAKCSGYDFDSPRRSEIEAVPKCSGYDVDRSEIEATVKCIDGHDQHGHRSGSEAAMTTRCRSLPSSPLGLGARAECSSSADPSAFFEAMAKCSYDPGQDFQASIAEMVAAHDEGLVHRPRDMLELLQCYLSLNAEECHGTIVVAFTRVWLELLLTLDKESK
jgi:uncharacterized protein (TIGR01568 family)